MEIKQAILNLSSVLAVSGLSSNIYPFLIIRISEQKQKEYKKINASSMPMIADDKLTNSAKVQRLNQQELNESDPEEVIRLRIECFLRYCYSVGERMRTHLGWEGITIDAVLGAPLIVEPVVHMYLLELVLVGEGAARHVDVVPRGVVHSEYHAVARVADSATHLQEATDHLKM